MATTSKSTTTSKAIGFWDVFPTLAAAGTALVGGIIGARASKKAAEVTSEAGVRAAELQAQTARESLALAREVYNLEVGLNWPSYVTSTGALGKLALGTGIKTPEGLFD